MKTVSRAELLSMPSGTLFRQSCEGAGYLSAIFQLSGNYKIPWGDNINILAFRPYPSELDGPWRFCGEFLSGGLYSVNSYQDSIFDVFELSDLTTLVSELNIAIKLLQK